MRAKVVLVALAAVLFPLGLAVAVYATSAPSLAGEVVTAPALSTPIARPSRNAPPTTTEPKTVSTDTSTEDVSGNCDEAEHANDPECRGGSGGSDNSGSGSDNSGSGSGSSGSGGGDD